MKRTSEVLLGARSLSVLVLVLWVAGCGGGPTPALSHLSYDGPAPDSPLVLLLSVDFRDDDADLASCTVQDSKSKCALETFINQRPTSAGPLSLLPIFVQSKVPQSATTGTLHFVLELSFSDQAPAAGSTFTLGARAVDAANNTSSTQEIKLKLEDG